MKENDGVGDFWWNRRLKNITNVQNRHEGVLKINFPQILETNIFSMKNEKKVETSILEEKKFDFRF